MGGFATMVGAVVMLGAPHRAVAQTNSCDRDRPACIQVMNSLDAMDAQNPASSTNAGIIPPTTMEACVRNFRAQAYQMSVAYNAAWRKVFAQECQNGHPGACTDPQRAQTQAKLSVLNSFYFKAFEALMNKEQWCETAIKLTKLPNAPL
ncbi:MAG: hypothetical protein KGJ73_09685 [Rhodospirillales bacterium]|nr:hypothetical protein [Rhodospirillales bacterium]